MLRKVLSITLFWLWGFSLAIWGNSSELRLGTQNTIDLGSLALASGFLKEELQKIGVSLKVLKFDSGKDMNAAFAAKSIDIGGLGLTPFVIGAVSNLGVGLIRLDGISYESEGLVGRKGKFKSLQDIKGQKIAVPFGTSAHFALLQILRLNNISPKEVKLLDIPAGSIVSAWERGDVDLVCVWELYLSALRDKEFLYTDKQLFDNGVILAGGISSRVEFAKENPQVIAAYRKAVDRAYELITQNRSEATKILANYFGLDEKVVDVVTNSKAKKELSSKELESKEFFGTKERPGNLYKTLYEIAKFLKEQNFLRKIPDENGFKEYVIY